MDPECRQFVLDLLDLYRGEIVKKGATWVLNRCAGTLSPDTYGNPVDLSAELFRAYRDAFDWGDYSGLNALIRTFGERLVRREAQLPGILMAFLSFRRGLEPVLERECTDAGFRLQIFSLLDSLYEYSVFRLTTLVQETFHRLKTPSGGVPVPGGPEDALRRAERLWQLQREIERLKRAEEALREDLDRKELAMKGSDIAMWDSNVQTHEVFFDERWSAMLGYARQELPPRPGVWERLIHPDDKERSRAAMQAHLKGETPFYETEHRLQTKSGAWKWVLDRGKVVEWDLDGKPLRATGTQQDIDERKRNEAELRKLSMAVEQSPAVVLITDREGKIEYANPRFSELTGYPDGEVRGRFPWELGDPSDAAVREFWERALAGEEGDGEFLFRKKGGGVFWERSSVRPIRDGEGTISHLLKVAEDTTARRKAEEDLKRTLEDLERSNKDLEQFAYVASHDLQEPLRVVDGYLDLLTRRYGDRLDAEGFKFLDYSRDAARRMRNLISDLLDYSRVGTQGRPFEPVEFDVVLDEALANLGAALTESAAEVTRDRLPTLLADGPQLVQLFQNLVGNALKFRRDEPARVHVSAERAEEEWVFRVRDNGIGVAPEHAERIFKIFKRLHRREKYSGTGIGLAICKRIVERHGGRIWVDGKEGEGSTFTFTIPIVGGPKA